jgi:hypothetical protein|tara:strand:- start:418 stop:639 length:222 start_codon:yes stop_codon:yes gene_type:complete
MEDKIYAIIVGLGILIWIVLIYIGMIIITKKIINYNNGITLNQDEQNITKMSIIMFWLTFVPLSIISFYFLLK